MEGERGAPASIFIHVDIPTALPEGLLVHDDSLLPLWNEFAEALSQLSTYAHCGFLPKIKIQLSTDDLSILELV